MFVWEQRYYPAWYFPVRDVRAELRPNGGVEQSNERGEGTRYDIVIDGGVVADSAYRHVDSPVAALPDLVRIEWDATSWFEEDVEVFVHPRSREARIDALPTSRRVRVVVDGVEVADSRKATVLFETGLTPSYYLPKSDIRMELLTSTATVSACPTKGGRATGASRRRDRAR